MPFSGRGFEPEEVALLGRVFERTSAANENRDEREQRALLILSLYGAGVTDEIKLEQLLRDQMPRRTPNSATSARRGR
ncbi:hypothetical protein [Mesorhizobium sp.]|uniref:hypothetical protein n=1 Tax=Mesorhizobium sp. TaxID=1871066 RepID=UPI000FE565B1|nr:hypothetical protein [Mesorhizobium sp.]RWE29785.1 MAG: hypothetical protein EOS77_21785 [Mesorhizobium sp.]